MQFSIAAAGHSLFAALVPPAIGEGDIIRAIVRLVAATRANEVGETVIVRAARTARFGLLEIAETTPADGYIVRLAFDIEIAIAAILEITVIDPHLRSFVQTEIIPSVAVIGTRSLEREIAEEEVTAFEVEDAGIGLVLLVADEFDTRQRHDGEVGAVGTDVVGNRNIPGDDDNTVALAERALEFALAGNECGSSVTSTRNSVTGIAPGRGSAVVDGRER